MRSRRKKRKKRNEKEERRVDPTFVKKSTRGWKVYQLYLSSYFLWRVLFFFLWTPSSLSPSVPLVLLSFPLPLCSQLPSYSCLLSVHMPLLFLLAYLASWPARLLHSQQIRRHMMDGWTLIKKNIFLGAKRKRGLRQHRIQKERFACFVP